MGHDHAWHRDSDEHGLPQAEHGSHASSTALGLTFLAMVFGVAFVILILVIYYNSYTSRFKAEVEEGVAVSAEYRAMRASSDAKLSSSNWIDRTTGRAHIPLEAAAEQVLAEYESLKPAN